MTPSWSAQHLATGLWARIHSYRRSLEVPAFMMVAKSAVVGGILQPSVSGFFVSDFVTQNGWGRKSTFSVRGRAHVKLLARSALCIDLYFAAPAVEWMLEPEHFSHMPIP